MHAEFESRDTVVIALSQEDTDLAQAGRMASRFEGGPRFRMAADLERAETTAYDRTTAYLIDERGVVRQVFPMIIHARPSWKVIVAELDRLSADEKPAVDAPEER